MRRLIVGQHRCRSAASCCRGLPTCTPKLLIVGCKSINCDPARAHVMMPKLADWIRCLLQLDFKASLLTQADSANFNTVILFFQPQDCKLPEKRI